MAQTVLGVNDFSEQPKKRSFVRGKGWVTVRTWLGPRAKADAFINDTVSALDPDDINVTEATPCVIEASFTDVGYSPLDPIQQAEDEAVWNLVWQPVEKPLGTHGYFQPNSGNAIALGAQEAIHKAIKDGTAYDTDFNAIYSGQGFSHGNDFRNLLLKGTDSWRTWVPVISQTMTISRLANFQISRPNAGKVIKYNEIDIPDAKWEKPKLWLYRENENPQWSAKDFDEWLEQPANITFSKKSYEVKTEWIGAVQWYSVLYQGGTAGTDVTGFE